VCYYRPSLTVYAGGFNTLDYSAVHYKLNWSFPKEMKMAKEILVVGSKIKEYIKSKDCMTSGELIPALSEKVECLLDKAIERAKANKRKTVGPQDV